VPEDEFLAVLDLIADRRAADVFPLVARLADAGMDFGGFLTGLADLLRAQLTVVLGGAPADVSARAREALEARRERFTASDLLRMLGVLTELEPLFKKSGQQQLLVETTLVRFALLDRSVDLESLLRGLGEGHAGAPPTAGRREAGGSTGPFARPEPLRGNPEGSGDNPPAPRAPTPDVTLPPLELHRLTGEWDAIVARMLGEGKKVLATALQHATPVAVTADGAVTIELDEPNDIYERAFESGRPDVLSALRDSFHGVARVSLRTNGQKPTSAPKRVTHEMIRSERLAALRKRDATLGAAIDELDLDVVD
jgi:DNA polymerase-3 subunit gamma/tau